MVGACGDDLLGVGVVQESERCVSAVVVFPMKKDDLACTEDTHANVFNLDHNPEGELPMFCRCGEVDFNDEDLDVDFQTSERWLSITQKVE